MAEKFSYPQIPATVWWGVRNILQRSPSATINERTLGVELNVQEVAARQYLTELKRVGILNEESKATVIAQKWRHDETYGAAVDDILRNSYPEGLIQIAPRGSADRQKIISWLTREGLGSGTAGNKAATYLMISSETPNESNTRGNFVSQKTAQKDIQPARKGATQTNQKSQPRSSDPKAPVPGIMPLNINVQIHISAEATGEQIESIFSSMRRYLYDVPPA